MIEYHTNYGYVQLVAYIRTDLVPKTDNIGAILCSLTHRHTYTCQIVSDTNDVAFNTKAY